MDTTLPVASYPAESAVASRAMKQAVAHQGPKAARLGDPIEHTRALEGFLIGAVVGLAVGAAVVAATVATGGAALAVVAAVGTAAATTGGGALLGHAIGELTTYRAGQIAPICSTNVLVNKKPAARAIIDVGACSRDGPPPKRIAQGSKTVMINKKPAARVDDRLECDGKISDGSSNVRIGREAGTYLEITPEVPEELLVAAEVLMWAGTAVALLAGGAAAAAAGGLCGLLTFGGRVILGLAGSLLGSEIAAPIGRALGGERGEIIARAIGGLLGGGLGSRTTRGHPIDVATGELLTSQTDFVIDGPLPLVWSRLWMSSSPANGALGYGWHHSYDMALRHCPENGGWAARLGDGRLAVFLDPMPGRPAPNTVECLFLETDGQNYALLDYDGLRYAFGAPDLVTGLRYLIRISDANGNAIEFQRGPRGRLDAIHDSAGRVFRLSNDDYGRITAIDAPHPDREGNTLRLVTYTYDPAGDLVEARDARGAAFGYRYDNHLLVEEQQRAGLAFHFVWDDPARGRRARCVDTWGNTGGESGDDEGLAPHGLLRARFAYDLEARQTIVVNGRGAVTRYRWNELGLVDEEIDSLGGVTTSQWDAAGRLLRVTRPSGSTSWEYDSFGRLIAEIDAAGGIRRLEYAPWGVRNVCHGNPLRVIEADGAVHEFGYDQRGNVAAYCDPTGRRQWYDYGGRGELRTVTDELGTLRHFVWSTAGELLAEEAEDGEPVRYAYDRLGRMIAMTSGEAATLRVTLDPAGNVVEARQPDGGIVTFEYDADGRLATHRDALGHQTRWRYDGLPMPVMRVEPDGHIIRYTYDSELNLTSLINAKGERYLLEYDLEDRLVRGTAFDGRRLEYRYDDSGELVELNDAGRPTWFVRDAQGRLIEKRFADGTMHRFAWDAAGRLTGADNPSRRLAFTYDAAGRLQSEQQDEYVLRHSYDARGRLVQTGLPDGRCVSFDHDDRDLLSAVRVDSRLVTRFGYDGTGREIGRRAGALYREQTFDPQGRLRSQRGWRWRAMGEAQTIFARRYGWDAADGLSTLEDTRRGLKRFHTDPRGRLLATEGSVSEYFVVDPADNIIAAGPAPPALLGDGAPGDRLLMMGDSRFTYDAHGNRIHEVSGVSDPVEVYYRYGSDDQLVEVVERSRRGTQWTRFEYDALGRRISKASAALPPGAAAAVPAGARWTRTSFLWDDDVLLAESTTKDDPLAIVYLHEPGTFHPLAQLRRQAAHEPAVVLHYHLDHIGTPQEITDDDGEVVWAAELKAWGGLQRTFVEQISNPLRFPGQYHDPETGLHYNRFRYYAPKEGRFIQPDPLGLDGGENAASYAPHPALWTDPLGLKKRKPKGRTHIAYVGMKNTPAGPKPYSGYASAPGDVSAESVLKRRYSGNKMNQFVQKPTVVYRSYGGKKAEKAAKATARGMEHANFRAMEGDPDPSRSPRHTANRQRPVGDTNRNRNEYHRQAREHIIRDRLGALKGGCRFN
jgi:RHS repeat-associated protein